MKKILFYLFILLNIGLLEAQTLPTCDLLFPRYEEGVALLKNGLKMKGKFNYSMLNQQVQYIGKDSVAMTFEKPNEVDYVIIAERIFEYTPDKGVLERISVGDSGAYYVEWHAKWVSSGKHIGAGHHAQSYSTVSYKNLDEGAATTRYSNDEGMTIIPECSFYLNMNGKFKRFNSASSLAKTLGCCKKELEEFVKEENIHFNNPDDVYRMMLIFETRSHLR